MNQATSLRTEGDSKGEAPSPGGGSIPVVRINARLNVGGIARHVTWLTAGLQAAGFDSLLVTGTVPPGEEDMVSFVESQGVKPLIIPEMSREISLKDLITIWKLYRLFVRIRPAIVHTHAAKAGAVGRVAGILYRWFTPGALLGRPRLCKYVHTFHGHIFHSYYGRCKTWFFLTIEKLLARIATDQIVVISPQQYAEIHEHFGVGRAGQFRIIPLGLDLNAYAGWSSRRHIVRDELGAKETDILVGIVGRLTEIKDHGLFLRVVAQFLQDHGMHKHYVRFVIVGNGHLGNALKIQSKALGLDQAVTFLGMRDDPQNFYPALDVVALTSRNEGTPLTLIEAMANARPVIATNVGGVVDLLGPVRQSAESGEWTLCERGVLVQPGNSAAFSNGLARLVEDAVLRRDMGERGRIFVEKDYSKERLLQDIAKLYEDLLTPEERPPGSPAPFSRPDQSHAKAGDACVS
jgi:glycosyltransferase involved in cell wall biosynthesis